MRELVLDTETTGLDPATGHRVVEVACLELINRIPSGEHFHRYLNPDRDMPDEAFRIHGLNTDFLSGQPRFTEVAGEFLDFLGESRLVIHNAQFDIKFLNAELDRLGHPPIAQARAVDTVAMARQRFPGAQVSLDALCRRFEIDNSARTLHGALLDCQLLAEVYLELTGGRQPDLGLARSLKARIGGDRPTARPVRPARPHAPSEEETLAHAAMLSKLTDPIWDR